MKKINISRAELDQIIKEEAEKLGIFDNNLNQQQLDELFSGLRGISNWAAKGAKKGVGNVVQGVSNAASAVGGAAQQLGANAKQAYQSAEEKARFDKQQNKIATIVSQMKDLHSQYQQLTGKKYSPGTAVSNPIREQRISEINTRIAQINEEMQSVFSEEELDEDLMRELFGFGNKTPEQQAANLEKKWQSTLKNFPHTKKFLWMYEDEIEKGNVEKAEALKQYVVKYPNEKFVAWNDQTKSWGNPAMDKQSGFLGGLTAGR